MCAYVLNRLSNPVYNRWSGTLLHAAKPLDAAGSSRGWSPNMRVSHSFDFKQSNCKHTVTTTTVHVITTTGLLLLLVIIIVVIIIYYYAY